MRKLESNKETDYIIATASTCDLKREYLDEHEIPFIGYTYVMDGKEYVDDCREKTRQQTYKMMRKGKVLSTSAINMYSYREFFADLFEKGHKNVIFLDMTRPLSSSYKYCDEAIEDLKEEYPDCTVVNVDTRCVSGGLGLLVEKAVALREAGESMESVLDWIEKHKLKIAHRFTVDDLKWLRRGGRVSNSSALIGNILSIKPVLYVPDEGTLVAGEKVRGRKAALSSVFHKVMKDPINTANPEFLINHADCLDDAEYIRARILATYPNARVDISGLGVVIGAHCGPGLFTIFYMTDKRRQ